MSKAIALILIALGAQVSAEDNVAAILAERASQSIGDDAAFALDDVTLAKPKKQAGSGKSGGNQQPRGWVEAQLAAQNQKSKTTLKMQRADRRPGRVFGGTNKLLAGAGQAAQATGPAIPSYWGGKKDQKGVGYGWSLGLKRNKDKSGKVAIKAEPEINPYTAPLVANLPRFAPVRPMVAGARPFLAANPIEATVLSSLSDIAFFVVAMGIAAFAVLLSQRHGNPVSEMETSAVYTNLEA